MYSSGAVPRAPGNPPSRPAVEKVPGRPSHEQILCTGETVLHHRHDCLIALFHDAELHQHLAHLRLSDDQVILRRSEVSNITRNTCQRSAEILVHHQLKHRQASGDDDPSSVNRITTTLPWAARGSNPARRIKSPELYQMS